MQKQLYKFLYGSGDATVWENNLVIRVILELETRLKDAAEKL